MIPLRHKTKKCILVGDPYQLPPTVISRKAIESNYELSLFQRMMKSTPKSILLLKFSNLIRIQYRMHPSISAFPSKMFYSSKLTDDSALSNSRNAEWHKIEAFRPFTFFDVYNGQEKKSNTNSTYNDEEVEVCANLIQSLLSKFRSIDVYFFNLVFQTYWSHFLLQGASSKTAKQVQKGFWS